MTCVAQAPQQANYVAWRWTVTRATNQGTSVTVGTCDVHFKWGEGRHTAPKCMPGRCADNPQCSTCTDPSYEIPDTLSASMSKLSTGVTSGAVDTPGGMDDIEKPDVFYDAHVASS